MPDKQKINNFIVKPINIPKDKRPVKGANLFPKAFCSVFLLGKKESGKTNTIFNIMCNRIETNTTIVIYSSTLYCDPAWLAIKDFFTKKKVPMILHTSIYENGNNTLKELVEQLEDEAEQRDKDEKEKKLKKKQKNIPVKFDDEENSEDEEEKEKKPKLLACDWMIILDDLSDEVKDKSLETLIKKHRHHKSMIIISNQTLNDVAVATRKNIDYYLLYRDVDDKKLEEIYNRCSLRVTFTQFKEMYDDAVYGKNSKPWDFFYFSSNKPSYRSNFNFEYKLPSNKKII